MPHDSGPPTALLSAELQRLIDGRNVLAGAFLSYTFEPDFFEQEVLPLLSAVELSQEIPLRMLQLEEELRGSLGPITVVYDHAGLQADKPARLNVRYCPVAVPRGCFHPKMILLLVGSEAGKDEELICGVLSANLTRSGWWRSVEAARFESLAPGSVCRFRQDLLRVLREVQKLVHLREGRESLDQLSTWISRNVKQADHETHAGRLRTRLLGPYQSLEEFVESLPTDHLQGACIEIVSPFFDGATARPLEQLVEALGPSEVRLHLPVDASGAALCTPAFRAAVEHIEGASWGQLDQDLLNLGKEKTPRGVHAKVYRFTTAQREVIMVGSHNLTTPALGGGRNFEVSLLFEDDHGSPADWWVKTRDTMPQSFAGLEDDPELPLETDAAIPLQVSFDWKEQVAEYFWSGDVPAPRVAISAHGNELFDLLPAEAGTWAEFDEAATPILHDALKASSLLQVRLPNGTSGVILVQETGMSRKPSMVVTFTAADIIEYWSRLTADQRATFLESRFGKGLVEDDLAELVARPGNDREGFFETYAGIFHGFEMLRGSIAEALNDGRDERADYLVFGERHDSLPSLLKKATEGADGLQVVDRYLILLCARQFLRELRRDHPDFARERAGEVRDLLALTLHTGPLVKAMDLDADGRAFIAWFEKHFLKRVGSRRGSGRG